MTLRTLAIIGSITEALMKIDSVAQRLLILSLLSTLSCSLPLAAKDAADASAAKKGKRAADVPAASDIIQRRARRQERLLELKNHPEKLERMERRAQSLMRTDPVEAARLHERVTKLRRAIAKMEQRQQVNAPAGAAGKAGKSGAANQPAPANTGK